MHKILLLALGAAIAPAMRADYVYTFSGTDQLFGSIYSFVLDTSALITTDSTFFPGDSLTCPNCLRVTFDIDATDTPASAILYPFNSIYGTTTTFFYFAPGSFGTVGSYRTTLLAGINDGMLSVEPVPEPKSLPFVVGMVACCLAAFHQRETLLKHLRRL